MEDYRDNIEIEDAIRTLSENSLTESEDKELVESFMFDQLSKLRDQMEDPSDLDDFMKKHWNEIAALEKQPPSKKKSIILRAWECLKLAVKNGLSFIKRHWKKIMILVLLLGAFFLFRNSGKVIELGSKLFGKGSAVNAVVDKAKSFVGDATDVVGATKWIPVDAADVDDVSVGMDNGLWQSALKSTGQTVIGMLSDPDDPLSPIKWFKNDGK